ASGRNAAGMDALTQTHRLFLPGLQPVILNMSTGSSQLIQAESRARSSPRYPMQSGLTLPWLRSKNYSLAHFSEFGISQPLPGPTAHSPAPPTPRWPPLKSAHIGTRY